MATKYVANNGTGDGSAIETPMSLKAAFAECTAGNTYVLASGTYERKIVVEPALNNDWIINNKSTESEVVFESATGNAADVILTTKDATVTDGWYGTVYVVASSNSVILKFKNMTINPGAGADAFYSFYLRSSGAGNVTVTLEGCVVTAADHAGDGVTAKPAIYCTASSTGRINLYTIDTDVNISDTAMGLTAEANILGVLSLSGGAWTHAGTSNPIMNVKGFTSCSIDGVTFSSSVGSSSINSNILNFAIGAASSRFRFKDNTITHCYPATAAAWVTDHAYTTGDLVTVGGRTYKAASNHTSGTWATDLAAGRFNALSMWALYVANYLTFVDVSGNHITATNGESAVLNGIAVGVDGQTPTSAMGQIVVHDNIIDTSGTVLASGHGLLIGGGADYADVYNNKVVLVSGEASSVNIGAVFKANACNIHHNVIAGSRGLYLKGSGNNKIYNNVLRGLSTYALCWITDTDTSVNNVVVNNIIDGSSGAYAVYAETAGHFNNRFDYNDYVAGSTALSAFDGSGATKQANLAALKAYWAALTDSFLVTNDTHSLEVSPLYRDSANGDFSILPSSPLINAGLPGRFGGYSTIGTYAPEVPNQPRYRGRYNI